MAKAHDKIVFESACEVELMAFNARCLRTDIEETIDIMANSILHPKLSDEDIQEALESLSLSIEDQYTNPAGSGVLWDLTLRSCFGDQGMGNPTLYLNPKANKTTLMKYIKKYLRPERMTIVGIGVEHEYLVNLVKKYFVFDETTVTEPIIRKQTRWIGGDARMEFLEQPYEINRQNLPPLTSVTLAFQGFSVYDPDIYAIHVLETLLGGGASFSAGGPGKGILTKINKEYLSRFDFYSMHCQHQSFSDIGIFGITASAHHSEAPNMLEPLAHLVNYEIIINLSIVFKYVNKCF